jgi:hypothetical protein
MLEKMMVGIGWKLDRELRALLERFAMHWLTHVTIEADTGTDRA